MNTTLYKTCDPNVPSWFLHNYHVSIHVFTLDRLILSLDTRRTAHAYLTRNIPRIESEIIKGKSPKRTHMNVRY